MGLGSYALDSGNFPGFPVRTATHPRMVLSAATVPLYAHLGWNIDRNMPEGSCILRLPFVRICLLCQEGVEVLAENASG